MTEANTICHDLDLLDDWLAGKGYGEEAGLVLRALSLIHEQAREIEKLRAELRDADVMLLNQARTIRDYQDAALKETSDESSHRQTL